MRRCGNDECRECPQIRSGVDGVFKIKRHPRRSGPSPLPWRITRDNEIIDNHGNTVAWGYHEDFGALFDKIRLSDARLIIKLVNARRHK